MSYAYLIDPERRLVVTRLHGVLQSHDSVGWSHDVTGDPRFDPSFNHLCSFEDVAEVRMDVPAVQLASALSPFNDRSKRAFVMPTDLLYGFGRAFQLTRNEEQDQHRVFRDMPSAVAWLGLDERVTELMDQLRSTD
jgi:hypothetical protein